MSSCNKLLSGVICLFQGFFSSITLSGHKATTKQTLPGTTHSSKLFFPPHCCLRLPETLSTPGGPRGSRAIPCTAPTRTGNSPLPKTQQIKLHQEFLCSRSSASKCTGCFPLTASSRIGHVGHYPKPREFRAHIPLLAGTCAITSRSSRYQQRFSEVVGGESPITQAALSSAASTEWFV